MQQWNEDDMQILKDILKKLSPQELEEIALSVGDHPYWRTLLSEMAKPASDDSPSNQSLRERWYSGIRQNSRKTRFLSLMERYIDSYLRGERDKGGKLSRSMMENIVSNHSKWNRMMNQYGQGKQYQDDIRRVCFLFRLTFPEANERMWSAGQMFDMGDFRDFVLVDCLQKQIYSQEAVNQILDREGLPLLFPDD